MRRRRAAAPRRRGGRRRAGCRRRPGRRARSRRAPRRSKERWKWPKTRRRSATPSSSSASRRRARAEGREVGLRRRVPGAVPSPRPALSGSAPSRRRVAASSERAAASTPLRTGSPSGESVAAHDRRCRGSRSPAARQARDRLGRPAAEHARSRLRAASGRRRCAGVVSTASSAGRLPWMSKSSASIALHGPTLTLRLPVADDAGAARAGGGPRGDALVLVGAVHERSSSRWPTSTRRRGAARAASRSTC